MEQAIFENFDFLVKVKVLLGQSFFFFFFFYLIFFFNRRFGPGQDEWVKPNRPRQTGQTVVGGDIIALEGTCSTCKRVAG